MPVHKVVDETGRPLILKLQAYSGSFEGLHDYLIEAAERIKALDESQPFPITGISVGMAWYPSHCKYRIDFRGALPRFVDCVKVIAVLAALYFLFLRVLPHIQH